MKFSQKVFSLFCAAFMVLSFAVCSSAQETDNTLNEARAKMRAQYGENKQITDAEKNGASP